MVRNYLPTGRYVQILIKRIDDPRVIKRRIRGRKTGLGIFEYLALCFHQNELFPPTMKLTDEAIFQGFMQEFPRTTMAKSLATGKTSISEQRRLYNRGLLTNDRIPEVQSRRWTHDGRPAHPTNGLPLDYVREKNKSAQVIIMRRIAGVATPYLIRELEERGYEIRKKPEVVIDVKKKK